MTATEEQKVAEAAAAAAATAATPDDTDGVGDIIEGAAAALLMLPLTV